jgi:hypothetical protein
MKKIKPDVPIILFSGTMPDHLAGANVYVNKGESTARFLGSCEKSLSDTAPKTAQMPQAYRETSPVRR